MSDALRILQNPRRRSVIKNLEELGGESSVRELVRRVAKSEQEHPERKLRKSVYTSLIQKHLPKLEKAGIVEYDGRRSDSVKLLNVPGKYRCHLEVIERGDVPWCVYYLTLAIGGLLSGLFVALHVHFLTISLPLLIFPALLLIPALIHTIQTYGISSNGSLLMSIWRLPKWVLEKLGMV